MLIHLPPVVIDTLSKPLGAVKDVVWEPRSSRPRRSSYDYEKKWELLAKIGEGIAVGLFFTIGLIMMAACAAIMVTMAVDMSKGVLW